MILKIGDKVRLKTLEATLITPNVHYSRSKDCIKRDGRLLFDITEMELFGEIVQVTSVYCDYDFKYRVDGDDKEGSMLFECIEEIVSSLGD